MGFYRFVRAIVSAFVGVFYRFKVEGRENVPPGPLLICANHTSMIDPFFIGLAIDDRYRVRFMAKDSLFRFPPFAVMLTALGAFPVRRGKADISAIKESLRALRSSQRLVIFPEGTRSKTDDAETRSGAGMLATRGGAPVLPVYISRSRRLFARVTLIIGKPVTLLKREGNNGDAYRQIANEIMERVRRLPSSRDAV